MREEENLSERQIAERLKISERTVKRDVAKIRPYYERKFRHQAKLLQKEFDRAVRVGFYQFGSVLRSFGMC